MLRGVDVSHFKSDLNLAAINYDFVLAKATGGNQYVDDQCDRFVQQALAQGKKFGVFHYFNDGFADNDPIAEANWFVDNCAGYIGKGILVLDWESGGNPVVNNPAIAKAWLDQVFARTGVKPIIYMSLSTIQSLDWSAVIAADYGLWCAAWPNGNNVVANYNMDPNSDPNPHWDGNVNDCIWQFTSTGRIDGYGGNLDCDFFYGTVEAWDAYAGAQTAPIPQPTTTTTPAPPTPDPTTTTTTTEAPTPPQPDPTTTTTTTQGEQPAPSTTTTTTIGGQNPSPTGQSWLSSLLAGLGTWFSAIIKWLQGSKK